MRLPWKDYLLMHWPYLAALALGVVSAIYMHGYHSGQKSVYWAAEQAAREATVK